MIWGEPEPCMGCFAVVRWCNTYGGVEFVLGFSLTKQPVFHVGQFSLVVAWFLSLQLSQTFMLVSFQFLYILSSADSVSHAGQFSLVAWLLCLSRLHRRHACFSFELPCLWLRVALLVLRFRELGGSLLSTLESLLLYIVIQRKSHTYHLIYQLATTNVKVGVWEESTNDLPFCGQFWGEIEKP